MTDRRNKLAELEKRIAELENGIVELSKAAIDFGHQAQRAIAKQHAINEALERWIAYSAEQSTIGPRLAEVLASLRESLK